MTIHFICRGNILRSIIAETYLRSLNLKNIDTFSSGTSVDWSNPSEREHFSNTLKVLDRHNIRPYISKDHAEQLTQSRIDKSSLTVLMNQRVVDEASAIVTLPQGFISWDIIDIGEGNRTVKDSRGLYEDEIYKEIAAKVDDFVKSYNL